MKLHTCGRVVQNYLLNLADRTNYVDEKSKINTSRNAMHAACGSIYSPNKILQKKAMWRETLSIFVNGSNQTKYSILSSVDSRAWILGFLGHKRTRMYMKRIENPPLNRKYVF